VSILSVFLTYVYHDAQFRERKVYIDSFFSVMPTASSFSVFSVPFILCICCYISLHLIERFKIHVDDIISDTYSSQQYIVALLHEAFQTQFCLFFLLIL